jgi:hypothetical protein
MDNTLICYKLVCKRKDGSLVPLFMGRDTPFKIGEWMTAENRLRKGFAERVGFHMTLSPNAPHLKRELKSGEKRVWIKCEVSEYEYYNRPESQGGTWVLAQKIKVLEELAYV